MMQKLMNRRNKKGFTLIELIVVVAILAILAAVAIPRFANVRANAQAGANQSNAAAVLSACDISWTENQVEPNAANLVTDKYLKAYPSPAASYGILGSAGSYTVSYPVPPGANATKYTGTVQ